MWIRASRSQVITSPGVLFVSSLVRSLFRSIRRPSQGRRHVSVGFRLRCTLATLAGDGSLSQAGVTPLGTHRTPPRDPVLAASGKEGIQVPSTSPL